MENTTILEEDGELYELSLCELVSFFYRELWIPRSCRLNFQIFWCILYAVIALLAVIGNSLVIFVTLLRLR